MTQDGDGDGGAIRGESDSKNGLCVWDFTLHTNEEKKITDKTTLLKYLDARCKKWAFQLEEGSETHKLHYQGRVSLKVKTRKPSNQFNDLKISFSMTSNTNSDNDFYVTKNDTRIEGPWTDKDERPAYIPRQIREIAELRPWQKQVVESALQWDTRHINVIVDTTGNHGKSILKTWIGVYGIGRSIPFTNDYRDMMRMVMDTKKKPLYIIDIPRALKKDQLFQFFSGVETIKDGYAYDDRYNFKEEYFDCPIIWVMMNTLPESEYLSKDRWVYWNFNDEGDLQRVMKEMAV